MAEPKKPTLRIVDINENYEAPANPKPEELQKAAYARAMREGAKRATVKHDAEVKGVKSAHVDELNRSGTLLRRLGHRDGMLQGIVMGLAAAIVLGYGTWVVLREIVITNVSTQRVSMPNDGIPELVDRERPVTYERNPREPPSAP